jgi:DNA recombination protein RmuC
LALARKINDELYVTETQAEKETCLKNFKADIKNTIKDLSKKNYQNGENLNCPDFIFMYVPIENSLALIYDDRALINYAYENNIILIGNVSLLTTLRLVKLLLAEEKQRESVIEIAKVGTSLFEKFSAFCEDLKSIQKRIGQVDSDFKTAIGRFQRGEDSLFRSVEKLKSMGIITTKEIPAEFLEIKE